MTKCITNSYSVMKHCCILWCCMYVVAAVGADDVPKLLHENDERVQRADTVKKDLNKLQSTSVKQEASAVEQPREAKKLPNVGQQAALNNKQETLEMPVAGVTAAAAAAEQQKVEPVPALKNAANKPNPNVAIQTESVANVPKPVIKNFMDMPQIFNKYSGKYDMDMPESYKQLFYIFLVLSVVAVTFIVVKLFGLRLTRAERRYGVQGDRTTQELTPLPLSIEEGGNSEDEDHTLYELNRQEIRIF